MCTKKRKKRKCVSFKVLSLSRCLSLEVGNNSSSNAVRLWLPTVCRVSMEMPVGKYTERHRETEIKRAGERKASPPWRRALGKLSELNADQHLFPFRHRRGEPRVCEMNNNVGHFMKHIYLCEAPVTE